MSDEQRVRTMAGWIGVEISRSRARKASNPEFGLYRLRGSRMKGGQPETLWWTAYAFTLAEIENEINAAVRAGIPAAPADLCPRSAQDGSLTIVTTRWTSAYRGRRDLGCSPVSRLVDGPVGPAECGCPNRVGGGPPTLHRCPRCGFEGGYESVHEHCAGCGETARTRRREANDAFQAEHLERRAHGLEARHAAKLRRKEPGGTV